MEGIDLVTVFIRVVLMVEWEVVSGVGQAQNLMGSVTGEGRQTPNTHTCVHPSTPIMRTLKSMKKIQNYFDRSRKGKKTQEKEG